jgi:uncharacterized protein
MTAVQRAISVKLWIFGLMLLLLCSCYHEQRKLEQQQGYSWQKVVFLPSGLTVMAAKADSEEKRQKGLMGRKHLGDHEGMIFYFQESALHAFWMFNTPTALTLLFVDHDLIIVDIQNMEPCLAKKPEDCTIYVARRPSRYAIEISREVYEKYRINVGDRVRFEDG